MLTKLPTRSFLINILAFDEAANCFILQLIPIRKDNRTIKETDKIKMILHSINNDVEVNQTFLKIKQVCECMWSNPKQYHGIIDEELYVYRQLMKQSVIHNPLCHN